MHGRPPLGSGRDAAPVPPARQRSEARIALRVRSLGGRDVVAGLAESGPSRLRFPAGPGLEAVLLNTAGGMACGDAYSVSMDLEAGAALVATTTAAEKVYRSDGPVTRIGNALSLGPRADLAWLPQETILFDRARLERRLDVEVAEDARLLLFESLVFGRFARGERLREGNLVDRWRIRRAGRLVFADTLRLGGAIADLLDRPALGGGAAASGLLVLVSPDAQRRLEEARALLADATCLAAASAWNGLLAVRLLAAEPAALRRAAVRLIEGLRGAPMPRVWQA